MVWKFHFCPNIIESKINKTKGAYVENFMLCKYVYLLWLKTTPRRQFTVLWRWGETSPGAPTPFEHQPKCLDYSSHTYSYARFKTYFVYLNTLQPCVPHLFWKINKNYPNYKVQLWTREERVSSLCHLVYYNPPHDN